MIRVFTGLLCILALAVTLNANVEKTIFLGPSPLTLPNVDHNSNLFSLDTLNIEILDPHHLYILPTRLPVRFPTETTPHGRDSWYLIRGLDDGRRYEVRICWPATQPTDFWLDTFTLATVSNSPHLAHSVISFNLSYPQTRQHLGLKEPEHPMNALSTSLLFLRVQAAASYFTTNQTLMREPPPVHVDIILDPFVLNILPRSLGPTVVYIVLVSIFSWFISSSVYRWLLSIANEEPPKAHRE
ncbi:hypothetical protein DM02DRAFT_510508 [Periconia macrospinosa]|uniref:Uncharacterized protein n=1 Tax=Periconia macrospinosa TaxID=97972 RepID=A0A2V1EE45_9PLEO|nr:hypothetical protein DM02DRAFT_510508 [Periconia macrospinosa]